VDFDLEEVMDSFQRFDEWIARRAGGEAAGVIQGDMPGKADERPGELFRGGEVAVGVRIFKVAFRVSAVVGIVGRVAVLNPIAGWFLGSRMMDVALRLQGIGGWSLTHRGKIIRGQNYTQLIVICKQIRLCIYSKTLV